MWHIVRKLPLAANCPYRSTTVGTCQVTMPTIRNQYDPLTIGN